MLEVAEAQARIWASVRTGPAEWVTLADAAGRVLARDVAAKRAQPPQAMSAMDGYAVRAADTASPMRVVGEVPAGRAFERPITRGEAVRIFTGGVLPEGADAVLIQEDAVRDGPNLTARSDVTPGLFVRRAGLDFAAGWVGLEAGRVLDPRALGLAAAMGHGFLEVRQRPRVALIATGDELRLPGETPAPQQIISSNTTALLAMVRAWGGTPVDLGIVADEPASLASALDQARHADMVVTTGGASVGDFDLVQKVAGEEGMTLDFWKIRMRPGKPLIFGDLHGRPFLGLPGNPVSAAVCAIVFLRGALRRHLGLAPDLPTVRRPLAAAVPKNGERRDHMRGFARGEEGAVAPADAQDSSMFATFAAADVLIVRPPHAPALEAGEVVECIDLHRVFDPLR
ncbi:MAG: molybdopterin molybdotransferase MoeA [Geminicoccaceae bacterium]|nr:molybdopterin molybdotransferase MoeA [Geminicoccaceae bacterium]